MRGMQGYKASGGGSLREPEARPSALAVFARANVQEAPTWAFKFTDPLDLIPESIRRILYPFLPAAGTL
jgi:hypothetical protein